MATDEEITETIAGNVRYWLAMYRVSTERAAEALGVSPATMRLRKNGSSMFSSIELVRIAELVGCTVQQLVDDPRGGGREAVDHVAMDARRSAETDRRVAELGDLARRVRSTLDESSVAVELLRRELEEL